jgi:hypothetical protein
MTDQIALIIADVEARGSSITSLLVPVPMAGLEPPNLCMVKGMLDHCAIYSLIRSFPLDSFTVFKNGSFEDECSVLLYLSLPIVSAWYHAGKILYMTRTLRPYF